MASRILVIEDDEILNETLSETLEDEDYSVVSAFSGPEAVETCMEHSFNLVITDVRLPGSDGIETLTNIRSLQPDVRCILTSGYAGPSIPSQAMQLKVDDYLVKPYSLDSLLEIVRRTLQRPTFSGVILLSEGSKLLASLEANEELADLLQARTEAFRALFLGAKSGHLRQSDAVENYQELENLERDLWKQLAVFDGDGDSLETFRQAYIKAKIRVIHLKPGTTKAREWSGTPTHIQKALAAVKNSTVGLEELHYLPYLGQLEVQNLQDNGDSEALRSKVWG